MLGGSPAGYKGSAMRRHSGSASRVAHIVNLAAMGGDVGGKKSPLPSDYRRIDVESYPVETKERRRNGRLRNCWLRALVQASNRCCDGYYSG
jgi:hypothetical protein